jgi:hypothetical protein
MPCILLQIAIEDYAKWRPAFDRHKSMRQDQAGVTSERIYRNADDQKEVLVWLETADTNKTKEVSQSDEVKAFMKEAGVVGPPKVHVVP